MNEPEQRGAILVLHPLFVIKANFRADLLLVQ